MYITPTSQFKKENTSPCIYTRSQRERERFFSFLKNAISVGLYIIGHYNLLRPQLGYVKF